MYEIVKQLIFWCEVQIVTLMFSFNMVASAGALLHPHPVSTGSLKVFIYSAVILPHCVEESQNADLQFLSRLCTC